MAKYLLVGDPHAKPDNLNKIEELFDIIEEIGLPTIILGDLLDTKELVRAKCLNTYLDRLSESDLSFTVLVGNHDYFNLDCKEHSLEALKRIPNVLVVDTPTIVDGITFCPYLPVGTQSDIVRGVTTDILIGHFDIVGFDYGNGRVSDHGLTPETFKNRTVISGHYHKFQQRQGITYLGTPFSHSFGETDQEKYLAMFDSKSKHLDLIPTNFPQHRTLEYNVQEEKLNDCETLTLSQFFDMLDELKQDVNYYRIIVKGTAEDLQKINFDKYSQIKWVPQIRTESSGIKIEEGQTPQKQFKAWASEIANLDPDTVNLGLEVLSNV